MQVTATCCDCPTEFTYSKATTTAWSTRRLRCDECTRSHGNALAKARRVPAIRPLNVCAGCLSEFPPTVKRQGGTRQPRRCPLCSQVWELARVKRKDARRRIRRHGLTTDQYDALLASQGGTCAMDGCDRTDDGAGRMLHIDHDHDCCPGDKSCGQCVRGLLCARHNVGIGFFNNDPAALYSAIAYLESHHKENAA